MILPTTEYDIPPCLQQYLHHLFNKLIDGLTGMSITLHNTRHRYITANSQEKLDNADNSKKMLSEFERLNDLIQKLATYVKRQRYNIKSISVALGALDDCDMGEIITQTQLPLICKTAIEWRNNQNFQVQAPRTHLQAVLANLIGACQQACFNTGSGAIKLWMQQTAQFNQLHLQCSAALDFQIYRDKQENDVDITGFYLSLKACEKLLVALNGKVEIQPYNKEQGVTVVLSFPQVTEIAENEG